MSNIFFSLFYTSIINKNSFLARDQLLRETFFRKFFKTRRKMVASDTTLIRNLSDNVERDEIEEVNFKIVENSGYSLIEPILNRMCMILDGTGIGKELSETAIIPTHTNIVLGTCKIEKKGKELEGAKELISKIANRFDKNYFNLVLYDGLGYTKNIFNDCYRLLGAKVLVKTTEDLKVIKEVETLINFGIVKVFHESGFDDEMLVKYDITYANQMSGYTIDFPLKVAIISEKNVKTGVEEIFYVITNDIELTPLEMRYAAHLRWRIENNGFKLMNKLFETKKYRSKDRDCIENLYLINIIVYNILMLFLKSSSLKDVSKTTVVTNMYWCNLFYLSIINYKYSRFNDSS